MRLTEEQLNILERIVDDGFNKNTLVRAIAQIGIDKVIQCIDAVDFDWAYGDKPRFDNKNIQLTALLKINGLNYN